MGRIWILKEAISFNKCHPTKNTCAIFTLISITSFTKLIF